jgi:hypothetical protein
MTDRSEYVLPWVQFCFWSLANIWCSAASPFWRGAARDPAPAKKTRDSGLVVGAAYSHADMLKFDSLYVPVESFPCPQSLSVC